MKPIAFYFMAFLLCLPSIANAQKQNYDTVRYYGVYGGLNYNLHFSDFQALPGKPICCTNFEGGSGFGFNLGGLLEFPINHAVYFGIRLGVSTLDGTLSEEDVTGNTEFRDLNPPYNTISISQAKSKYEIQSSITMFDLEAHAGFKFFDRFYTTAGLKAGSIASTSLDQKEELLQPDNVVFLENGKRTRSVYNGFDMPELNSFQMFATFSLGYRIPVFESGVLQPEIRYSLPFIEVSSVDWIVSSLSFGAALKFPYLKPKPKPIDKQYQIVRDTVVDIIAGIPNERIELIDSREETTLDDSGDVVIELTTKYENYRLEKPKPEEIEIDLMVYGIDPQGKVMENPTVVIEETEYQEMFPLLPYVFFEQGSDEINRSSLTMMDKKSTDDFNPDKLTPNTLDIYKDMPNIIGNRAKNSEADLIITGCNNNTGNEQNNLKLSKARAEKISKYFNEVWDIPKSRIVIKNRNLPLNAANNENPDGKAENRRVEISSQDKNITAPFIIKDIKRTATPPVLEISPKFAGKEIDSAAIYVKHNNEILRYYSLTDKMEKRIWEIEELPIPRYDKDVQVELNVYSGDDSYQKSKTIGISQKTIRKKREILKDDKIIDKFALILFDYDKASLKNEHLDVLKEVKDHIKENTEVYITGYADRTGDAEYNENLANDRINNVLKALDVNNQIEKNSVGSRVLLYNNDTPEGRNYSRTVIIELRTPVK